jgi:hypothetical protein
MTDEMAPVARSKARAQMLPEGVAFSFARVELRTSLRPGLTRTAALGN